MSQPQSRAASQSPAPQAARSQSRPRASRSRGRNRSRSASLEPEAEAAPEDAPKQARKKRGGKEKQQGGSGLPGIDEVEDTGGQLTQTGGGLTERQMQSAQNTLGGMLAPQPGPLNSHEKAPPEEENDQILSLRLDVNLELELNLKARLHGDITLCLLGE